MLAARGEAYARDHAGVWEERIAIPKSGDVAIVCYTSGTTGPSKGALLTHANIIFQGGAFKRVDLDIRETDEALNFLPLCHVTQRLADYCYFSRGAQIVHVGLEDISAALAAVRPTTFAGVPRIFEKAREGILARAGASSAPMRALFRWALEGSKRPATS